MRVHLDKKPSDGAAIALFAITLLAPIALAILLSRLNAFFEGDAVSANRVSGTRLERRQSRPIVLEASSERSAAQCESTSIERGLMEM